MRRRSDMVDICTFLEQHGIPFEKFDHPAVFTCEEAERLCPPMPGTHTKNLFLRDRKGARHFLVVVGYDKQVDLKALTPLLHADKLSFASPERLQKYLGVEPGAATLLGLVTDTAHAVEAFIDADIWASDVLLCHPLVNTATLAIPHAGVERFLAATGHEPLILSVPARSASPTAA
ncbi:MAG: prolyl-tRNA synthetase associated domain-containing protein [Candidatus Peregrinibacteria bacterium]